MRRRKGERRLMAKRAKHGFWPLYIYVKESNKGQARAYQVWLLCLAQLYLGLSFFNGGSKFSTFYNANPKKKNILQNKNKTIEGKK